MTLFCDTMKDLNYSGGCCIDFKFVDDIIYIFEINPRFGGGLFTLGIFHDFISF
jgi:predicted ATP-grasp superfamily ATP-dependent carboligase